MSKLDGSIGRGVLVFLNKTDKGVWFSFIFKCGLFFGGLISVYIASAATVENLPAIGAQPSVTTPLGKTIPLYKESYALLISQSKYLGVGKDGWKPLDYTESELDLLATELRRHGFTVRRVKDATANEMISIMRTFAAEFGVEEKNRLLFYFSGHGFTRPFDGRGYVVPFDAPDALRYPNAFIEKAITLEFFVTWAKEITSKHLLMMFDSCFSGSIFSTKGIPTDADQNLERWRFLSERAQLPVRQIITAGSAKEELPANSEFLKRFLDVLQGSVPGQGEDGYVTGKQFGTWAEQTLPSFLKNQNPQSGLIRESAFEKGDIVFQLARKAEPQDKKSDDAIALEQKAWLRASGANTSGAYKDFLLQHPLSKFVPVAKRMVQELTAPSVPALLSLTKSRNDLVAADRPKNEFWMFLGEASAIGSRFFSKSFAERSTPNLGDRLKITNAVTQRTSAPEWDDKKNEWLLGKALGTIQPNSFVRVLAMERIESVTKGQDLIWGRVTQITD
jgi:Caspase domain